MVWLVFIDFVRVNIININFRFREHGLKSIGTQCTLSYYLKNNSYANKIFKKANNF